ncbi:4-hydroxy-tetrahydrodipicolinate reductase [Clostridium thermarum]|uniref:4-hydroxy-tetrahydrodipicolinate reductase n=1 Tax=Clostridium thermarum TaxID=1716543 RepID=UPI0013D2BAE2|nr:4-hydroxy-tetrahydrodipicolinate reductase [Clostridium thermarum]
MIKVCVIGLGRTGQYVAKGILEQKNMELVAAICSPGSEKLGKELGTITGDEKANIKIRSSNDLEEIILKTRPDVVVDFSNSKATMKNAKTLSMAKVNMVIGTTGFSDNELKELSSLPYKFHNGIVYAPNITLGINTVMLLSNIAANILNNYDFQITEIHHKHKKDAPSGTAVKLAREMERGLKSSGVYNKRIPINAIRAGGVVGRHEVQIFGEDDKIEISHESFSRKIFAQGAVQAINYIHKKTGYYEMKEVLDLKRVLYDCINSGTEELCL